MLSFLRQRFNTDTLIWEYLDGEISPSRAKRLSNVLSIRASARQRFVEAAVMHGMLFDYFKKEHERSNSEEGEMPTRRKRGRTSAA